MPTPRSGYIYLVTNSVNGKCYIGQTRYTLRFRWNRHVRDAKRKQSGSFFALHKAIAKYGEESFTVRELAYAPEAILDSLEIVLISEMGTMVPCGYNLTRGGGGTSGHTYLRTDEWRSKQSKSHKGQHCSDETKAKLRAAHAKRTVYAKRGPETGDKIRAHMLGRKLSESTKLKMSASRKGVPQGKHSEETRNKISQSHKEMHQRLRMLSFCSTEPQRTNCGGHPHLE